MSKTMGVSPITDVIYYGTVKDDMWQGKKESHEHDYPLQDFGSMGER